jgi:hypothetical protein
VSTLKSHASPPQVRRLKEFGVTHGELTRYLKALLKDSEQLAAMIDNIPSIDNLDFIMESDALGHVIMDQQQGHECLSAVADSVSLEDVSWFSVLLYLFLFMFSCLYLFPCGVYLGQLLILRISCVFLSVILDRNHCQCASSRRLLKAAALKRSCRQRVSGGREFDWVLNLCLF